MNFFVEARKTIVSVAAGVGALTALGLLHGAVQVWVTGAIAAANAVLVYWVPNGAVVPVIDDSGAIAALLEQNELSHWRAPESVATDPTVIQEGPRVVEPVAVNTAVP